MDHRDIYFGLMLAVLKADHRVQRAEKDAFMSAMHQYGVSPRVRKKYRAALEDRTSEFGLDSLLLPGVWEPSEVLWLLRDAYFMASCNGQVADAEISLLRDFLSRLGFTARTATRLLRWAEQNRKNHARGLAILEGGEPHAATRRALSRTRPGHPSRPA